MSIINDKKSIITDISVLSSIGKTVDIPDANFTYPSVSNKNEPIPFMLDLLTALIGSEALTRTTGEIMTNFVRKIEPDLKQSLKKQVVTFNSDQTLPSGFTGAGYELPVKNIDIFSKLKTDPSSQAGGLLYASEPNGFDKTAYNAITASGSDVTFNNITMNYDESNDSVTVKPTNTSDTIGNFLNTYIDGLKIIDEKEFTTQVLNAIYGTLSSSTNKPLTSIIQEEKINTLVDKISQGENNLTISEDELREIQNNAANKLKNVVPVDVGCSIVDSKLSLEDIGALISGNTSTNDPMTIGNNFDNLMVNSFGTVPNQINPQNKNAIRDGFFKRLIKTIVNALTMALTSTPQIRVLFTLVKGFKNNNDVSFSTNIEDDINSQKNFISCLSNNVGELINEFIFNLLKTELIKLIIPVTTVIIREKILSYIRIIQNLII